MIRVNICKHQARDNIIYMYIYTYIYIYIFQFEQTF